MIYPKDVILAIPRSGQSLAYGAEGTPLLNPESLYSRALMLGPSVHSGYDGGAPLPGGLELNSLKSVSEESIDMGYANHIFGYTRSALPRIVFMYHGWGGYSYTDMRKGTACWDKGVAQLRRVVELSKAQGKEVIVPCFDWIGGENGHAFWASGGVADPEKQYTDWMLEYHKDINEVYRSITGQAQSIPIVWCQSGSHSFYYRIINNPPSCPDRPTTALVTTKLSNQYPDKFITAGAKYHLPTGSARSVHLNAQGYQSWGKKRGQIFLHRFVNDNEWKPLQPLSAIFLTPTTVRVSYEIMFGPLVLDDSVVSNPGNYGFQYVAEQSNGATITEVSIETGGNAVLLKFDREPKGLNRSIGYAYNNANPDTYTENFATFTPPYPRSHGPVAGPRGCLRDSDPATSFGTNLYNYAVHSITKIT